MASHLSPLCLSYYPPPLTLYVSTAPLYLISVLSFSVPSPLLAAPRPPGLSPSHFATPLQCPAAAGRTPCPAPTGSPFLAPSPPPPLSPVRHSHPPALRGWRPGLYRDHCSARSLVLCHSAAAPTPRAARPGLWGAPTRLRYLAPHATRPLPAGDSLRGPTAPAAARCRRPAPACAVSYCPGPGLRGAYAHWDGRHAASGGLRGPWLPLTAAALYCLRAGLPGGHALCRRDPGGNGSNLHAPPAAPGAGASLAGAEAPAARLHAHRGADHHLLLLAYGHHRHLQGSAGAHGLGPRRHSVGRDCFPRGPELLLHLPGSGHRSHGALYHSHGSYHHCRAAPRELLGSVRTPLARPHPEPLEFPGASCSHAADPMGALNTCPCGSRTWIQPKLGLHRTFRLAGKLRSQFLRNPAKAHTPKDAASQDPSQMPGFQTRTPSKCSAPSEDPWVFPWHPGDWSPKTCFLIGSAPALTKPRLQVGRLRLLFVHAG